MIKSIKNWRVLLLGAILLAAFPSVHSKEKTEETPVPSVRPASNYKIGPGDILEIVVRKEEDLIREVLVPPDGVISFPLAGSIQVEGKTIAQVEDEIRKRLSDVIVDPVVTVFLRQTISHKFYVIGKVNAPGEFPITGPVDVMQALAKAGGLATFADHSDITILRRDNGALRAIHFNYSEVADGVNLDQNILLEKGDVVVVQ